MSEIDRPANQDQPKPDDVAQTSPVAPVWPTETTPAPSASTAASPYAAPASPAAASTPGAPVSGAPASPAGGIPSSGGTVAGGYGNGAYQPTSGYPAAGGYGSTNPPAGGYSAAGGPYSAASYPSGSPSYAGGTSSWQAGGEAGSARWANPTDPAAADPTTGQYPHWTPPAARPKRVPTAVKWIAGSAAAVVLALCSGITGALIATAIDNDGGINIPVNTNAAPVVDRSTLAGVAAEVQPSVVSIATGTGEGSGVILSEDGYILTNNHVVETAQGDEVTVTLSSGKKLTATIVGTDPRTDLAVIKANTTGLKAATFGDSNRVQVGDTVLAIGSPLGLQGSVTSGIISAKDRTISANQSRSSSLSGLLQTDAPINPGNSGGALVNMNGDVIGINTAIATSGGVEGNIGVGFAIPSLKAKQVAEQLIKGEKVSHPFLGVSVTPEATGGARISAITAGSPAEAAGLRVDDVVTKFGDRVVNDSNDLVSAVQSGTVGQKVTVEYVRNGETQTATVTLGEAS